jgi:hypothetical protein
VNYGEVLDRGLRISWRHRYLWLLALFGGEYAGGGSFSYSQSTTGSSSQESVQPYLDWITGHAALLVALGLIFAVLVVLWFFAGCVASGGLVRAVAEIDAGHAFSGRQAWAAGLRTFWAVLALRLLYFLVTVALAGFLIGLPVLLALSHPPGSLLLLLLLFPLGLLFLAYAVLADVVYKLALRCLVLELLGATGAIRSALRLLFRRFGRVALFWLILIGVGIGVGVALGIPFGVIGLALLAPLQKGFNSGNVGLVVTTVAVASGAGLLAYLVVAALLGTYWSAVWTVAYRRFDLEPGSPPPPSLAAR